MPRPALTPEQRQNTRELIRDAAAVIVRQGNLTNFTIRAVAKEAGVSVGTIYQYFKDITDLGRSLWQEPVEELRKQMAEIVAQTNDPASRIRALLQVYADFAIDKHRVFRGALLYVRPESREKPEQVALEQEPFFGHLETAIGEGQKSGLFVAGDKKLMAQLLWSALHGALALPNNMERIAFDPPERLAEAMIEAIMKTIETNRMETNNFN